MTIRIVILIAIALIGSALWFRPDRSLSVAAAVSSATLCSKTFAAGLDPKGVEAEHINTEPGIGLIAWAKSAQIDRDGRSVSTRIFGVIERTARFHEGYGCVLDYGQPVPPALPPEPASDAAQAPDGVAPDDAVVPPATPALAAAVANAFAEWPDGGRFTKAVLIVHKGRIVAEHYGPGYSVATRFLSHSIAKSVMTAVTGVLVAKGKLSPDSRAWTPPANGAATQAVSFDRLLRNISGLPLDEGIGFSLAQDMWFRQSDMARFASAIPLEAAPGTRWRYSNLGWMVLSRALADTIGGSQADVAAFIRDELFRPAGMTSAVMEFDAAGTPMGANSVLATARDWARFGLLFLNDGVVQGRRILPEGWTDYCRKQTLNAGYGAGFWLNVTASRMPVWDANWGLPGAPRDAYMARGYRGQWIVIVPSEDLVVVRFGLSTHNMGDVAGVGRLVGETVAALRATP